MLTIDPPIYLVRGSVVFRDHVDADQFYVLPGQPRLAAGGPFRLLKYRRDLTDNPGLDPTQQRGGGFASFETELAIDRLEALRADVASAAGRPDARLAPVVFRSGTVSLIGAHGGADAFVEDVVDIAPAPLIYPHHAAFGLALSAEGASLFAAAAADGTLPVGVVYDLHFLALTPAVHARVRMDYGRSYDHFATSLGFTYYVSARLDLELSWLIEHDLVKIEILTFTDGPDRDRQERLVMELVKARIQADFFRSSVPTQSDAGLAGALGGILGGLVGGSVSSTSAVFVLKARYEAVQERKDFELLFDGATAVELSHVTSAFLATLASEAAAPEIREVDLDDPFFSVLRVDLVSAVDFTAMPDLASVVVDLAHGAIHEGYEISPTSGGPFSFQVPLDSPSDDRYAVDREYHFTPASAGPAVIHPAPVTTRRRVLVVNPVEDFRYVRLTIRRGPMDSALVPSLSVRVRLRPRGGGADLLTDVVHFDDPATAETIWCAHTGDLADPPRLFARCDWTDPHGVVHEGDESEVIGDTFVALGPYRDTLEVTVLPAADWTKNGQLLVAIQYPASSPPMDRDLSFVAPAGSTAVASQHVSFPLEDPAARAYRWSYSLLRRDGTIYQADWAPGDGGIVVAGREPPAPGTVRVIWVGPQGDAFGLRIDIHVTTPTGDSAAAAFLRPGPAPEDTVELPLDAAGSLHYSFVVTRIDAAGETVVRSGDAATNVLVVQSS